jgi:drug/metabolite transporter (DMT)-like permease
MEQQLKPKTILLLVLLTMIWGLTVPVAKIALKGFPPMLLGGTRFLLAGSLVFMVSLKRGHHVRQESRGNRGILLAYTLLLVIQIILLFFGIHYTTANRSSILFNTSPFWVLFLALFFLSEEQLSTYKWIGTGMAFAGVLVLFAGRGSSSAGASVLGDLLVLGAAITWGVRIVVLKHFPKTVGIVTIQIWQFILGGVILTTLGLFFENLSDIQPSWQILTAFLFLAVFSNAIGFALWTYLVTKEVATRVAPFIFLTPVFGVAASALLLGEPITLPIIISLVCVGCGIFIVNRKGSGRFGLPKNP